MHFLVFQIGLPVWFSKYNKIYLIPNIFIYLIKTFNSLIFSAIPNKTSTKYKPSEIKYTSISSLFNDSFRFFDKIDLPKRRRLLVYLDYLTFCLNIKDLW
ncbi:hypothetical protein AW14_12540 [Siansivirga zeaxanthinifaciens CC-SAMT-1]|uniref:Uncharacterized protein n=1 Tax=Siansivirga zeaxanthinifaciens CC-SAMT-1 TaxID=1454006 RepID=A0A0C5WD12_9FLAO|nr:hypothetical protein AW14_12540 [Siansivirga zeaxanthinifaciens CC-SAMT-1]